MHASKQSVMTLQVAYGWTPLHVAVKEGHVDMVEALLEANDMDAAFVSEDKVRHDLSLRGWRGNRLVNCIV